MDLYNKFMTTKIFDVNISTLSKKDTFGLIYFWLYKGDKGFMSTVNPEFLLLSNKDEDFKNILNKSKINTADGIGLVWASWLLSSKEFSKNKVINNTLLFFKAFFSFILFLFYKKPFYKVIKERTPGSELVYDITKIAAELNKKIFLLGGNDEGQAGIVEEKLNEFLEKEDIKPEESIIADKNIGFQKTESIFDEEINNRLIERINISKAEIIYVALGAPKQEKWIYNNFNKLENIKLAIGLGGTFDFIAGYKKRAPKIFQTLGLEWLFRLFVEPKRWKRIFNAVFVFPIKVFKEKIK